MAINPVMRGNTVRIMNEKNAEPALDSDFPVIGPTPVPISSAWANDLFDRVQNACQSNDGEALFDQFSRKIQAFFIQNKARYAPWSSGISYVCKDMREIRAFLKTRYPQTAYGMFRRGNQSKVCFYDASESIDQCEDGLRLTYENGRLKIDEH